MRHVVQSWRSPAWRSPVRMRPSVVRRVWLWSGLVLFTYVATHLANHALGLISLEEWKPGATGSSSSGATPLALSPSTVR